jgi:hypothetical protein
VPKKNGELKICIDFRKLNAATKKDPYPLSFIDEVLNIVVGYETFKKKMDIQNIIKSL